MLGLERLKVVRELGQKNSNWIHKDLFRILKKDDIWFAAYENIKGNKGALTPGITKETLDGTSIGTLRNLKEKVLEESYSFKPVKQTWIPKANGKLRPLGLPTPDDKIVQEVIRMVLEAVYEPIFDNRSFGFRSGKGVHDALKHVEERFRWVDWVIKGDIQNAYPTIDHKILRKLLGKRIEDSRFLNLINKSLKCGIYTNPETLYSKIGVPQGSIVSPILANIYFHELDTWIIQKEKEYFSEKSTKKNSKYRQLEYQISKISKQMDELELNSKERKDLRRQIKSLIQTRNETPSLADPGTKIEFVRYADDWMIGVKGPYSLAKQIKKEVTQLFEEELKQTLDPKKTQIINLRSGKVNFLGYNIFLPRNMKLVKYKVAGGKQTVRRQTAMLRFHVPVIHILQRLNERGYITYKNNKWRPTSKSGYTPLEDEVIVRHFASVWLGLLNFYSGATNWSHLQYIHYLLHMSCAMTLAHRHRSTSSKIFKKHGKNLDILDKTIDPPKKLAYFPYKKSWKVADRKWLVTKEFRDPFTIYANRVSRSSLNKPCSICKTMAKVEMHHVKHVRKNGKRYKGFHSDMAILNRKQVPLCRDCHMAVHRGDYDGIRLSILD